MNDPIRVVVEFDGDGLRELSPGRRRDVIIGELFGVLHDIEFAVEAHGEIERLTGGEA